MIYENECDGVLFAAPFLQAVRQQRQREKHTNDRHVAARPALIAVVVACKVRYHLPSVAVLGIRVVEREKVFGPRT